MILLDILEKWNDSELIRSLQNDDTRAFDVIYWKYHARLYSNINKLLKDGNASKDVLQEVFVTLWEKRASLDPKKEIAGWLFTVSYNKSINHLKKTLKAAIMFVDVDEAFQVAIGCEPDDETIRLSLIEKAVTKLSPQKRKVFDLCKLQGKTYVEAANELTISKHTVKEYLSEAVAAVKEYVRVNANTASFVYLAYLYQFFHK